MVGLKQSRSTVVYNRNILIMIVCSLGLTILDYTRRYWVSGESAENGDDTCTSTSEIWLRRQAENSGTYHIGKKKDTRRPDRGVQNSHGQGKGGCWSVLPVADLPSLPHLAGDSRILMSSPALPPQAGNLPHRRMIISKVRRNNFFCNLNYNFYKQ